MLTFHTYKKNLLKKWYWIAILVSEVAFYDNLEHCGFLYNANKGAFWGSSSLFASKVSILNIVPYLLKIIDLGLYQNFASAYPPSIRLLSYMYLFKQIVLTKPNVAYFFSSIFSLLCLIKTKNVKSLQRELHPSDFLK